MMKVRLYNVKDYRVERWRGFKNYFVYCVVFGECDPAYPVLQRTCNELGLNNEERYWLAFLYGTCYCGVTAFYIFSKFPDFREINIQKLKEWWKENKHKLIFQTDRAKIKNFDQFVPCVASYLSLVNDSQEDTFRRLRGKDKCETYRRCYEYFSHIKYFGVFSLFNYLELVQKLTGFEMLPDTIPLEMAESARNGVCYMCSVDDMVTLHHKPPKIPIDYEYLYQQLHRMHHELGEENRGLEVTFWNMETVLCAYKKLFWQTRYFGYYIDRQLSEINEMKEKVKEIDWNMFHEFRIEYFHPFFLGEIGGWKGIRPQRTKIFMSYGTLISPFEEMPEIPSKFKVEVVE